MHPNARPFEGIEFDGYTPADPAEYGILPLNGRILVELVTFDARENAHVFTDATMEQPVQHGVVLEIAPDLVGHEPRSEWLLQPGDVVMFGNFSGYEFEEDRFSMIRCEDVVAIRTRGKVKPKKVRGLPAPDLLVPARLAHS